MYDIIAQIIGIVSAGCSIVSVQAKKNRVMFGLTGIAGFLFAINMAMLGNYTAAALAFVNFFRGIVLMSKNRKYDKLWLAIIQTAYLLGCIFTFGKGNVAFGGAVMANILSVLTTVAILAETFVSWSRNGKVIRLTRLFIFSPVWLFSNAASASIGGVVNEALSIVSVIIAFARHGINGFEIEGKDGKALAETDAEKIIDEKKETEQQEK